MDDFIKAASPRGDFLKFKNPGDTHTLQITEAVEKRQQHELVRAGDKWIKGEPRTYKSGDPMFEYVISGLNYNAESEDKANAVLVVKARQVRAIGQALKAAGVNQMQVGGVLTLTFTHYGEGQGSIPPKEYEAKYVPASVSGEAWGSEEDAA